MSAIIRRRISISGRVQGVGFRPFIYGLAHSMPLAGFVGNNSQGVFIEIEGEEQFVEEFLSRLPDEIPPLATVSSIDVEDIEQTGAKEFKIDLSKAGGEQSAEISPDVATCEDCIRETLDPYDRRYGYAFTNCTNCGPRYSIIQGIPYDRPKTTMGVFKMCPECQQEYDDPLDRRFHAQPNACPVCGPQLSIFDNQGSSLAGDPVKVLVERLQKGDIAAIKGLGGFHLAVRADLEDKVALLRERKGREAKPFALMVGSLKEAEKLVHLDDASIKALIDRSRPIVLAPKKADANIAAAVAPDTDILGIMLPYTPFHHLLFAGSLGPLVMTSGNPSDEPLCSDNKESFKRLGHLVDLFLLHDRDIERRVDDSVVIAVNLGEQHGGDIVFPLRRSRGFVPQPIRLQKSTDKPILAVGGEMKSAVCIYNNQDIVFSEHLGELHNAVSYRNFVHSIDALNKILAITPEYVAYDLHPEYSSNRYAQKLDLPGIAVQHHHAHIVSCMADNGYSGKVIGLALDGTGYGTDETIWGGECLLADESSFDRVGHLQPFLIVGGDAAARDTWRPAVGLLKLAYGDDWLAETEDLFSEVGQEALKLTAARIEHAADRLPLTSSAGRLFDAVAFLLGVTNRNRYEAEAAIRLENIAQRATAAHPLSLPLITDNAGMLLLDPAPMIQQIIDAKRAGVGSKELALGFHQALIDSYGELAMKVAKKTGVGTVALSGGCFANRLLLIGLNRLLLDGGYDVLYHRNVSPGDGGLALGQAVIAAEQIRRGK